MLAFTRTSPNLPADIHRKNQVNEPERKITNKPYALLLICFAYFIQLIVCVVELIYRIEKLNFHEGVEIFLNYIY